MTSTLTSTDLGEDRCPRCGDRLDTAPRSGVIARLTTELDARRREHLGRGWIGVDLDGTLARYDEWVAWNVIGEPLEPMVRRVRGWLAEGHSVKIMTARVAACPGVCRLTGVSFSEEDMTLAIQGWLLEHVGVALDVTCVKDVNMIELWDDRAVQVVPNTGRSLCEEHEAELTALGGKAQG
jgi:hypothetical protein